MRALVLQHAATEGPGHLRPILEAAGFVLDLRRPFGGEALPASTADYDLVVALGGPQHAWGDDRWPYLAAERALLVDAARADRPTLAICLGAQLLALGLGADVGRGPAPEIGLYPITLTDAGRRSPVLTALDGQEVVHWHEDAFALPDGAVLLASSARYPHQAFSLGRRVLAVQFHPELDPAIREAWLREGADELAHVPRERFLDPAIDARHLAFARAFIKELDQS